MIRLRPTRNELIEMCVLTALAAGILFGMRGGVIDRELMPVIIGGYLVYLAVVGVRDVRRWLHCRAAASNAEG